MTDLGKKYKRRQAIREGALTLTYILVPFLVSALIVLVLKELV